MKKILTILIILVSLLFVGFVVSLFCLYEFHQIPYVYNPDIPKGCCENYPSCCVKGKYGLVQWWCSGICEKGGVVKGMFKIEE